MWATMNGGEFSTPSTDDILKSMNEIKRWMHPKVILFDRHTIEIPESDVVLVPDRRFKKNNPPANGGAR